MDVKTAREVATSNSLEREDQGILKTSDSKASQLKQKKPNLDVHQRKKRAPRSQGRFQPKVSKLISKQRFLNLLQYITRRISMQLVVA